MAGQKNSNVPHSKLGIMKAFCRSESGATAIEYAMIAVGLSIVIIGSVYQIGSKVNNDFASVQANYRQTN